MFVTDDIENQAAGWLRIIRCRENDRDVERLAFHQRDRRRQLGVDARWYLPGGLVRRIERQAQVGRRSARSRLGGKRDGERVVFRDVELVRRRPDGHAVDGERLLLRAIGNIGVHRAYLVQTDIGDGRFEDVSKVARRVGQHAEDAFETLLVEYELQACVRQRGFALPVECTTGDGHVLIAEGADRVHVGDFALVGGVDQRHGLFGAASGDDDLVVLARVVAQLVDFQPDADAVGACAWHVQVEYVGYVACAGGDARDCLAIGQGDDARAEHLLVGLRRQDVAVGVE